MLYKESPNRIDNITILRGIAAIGVSLCHIQQGTLSNESNQFLSTIINHGQIGVQIFFIISGFVLPLSLDKNHYKISDFFKFLLRRSIRIDIPFWTIIILYIGLNLDRNLILSVSNLLFNLFYLVPYLPKAHWYLEVFWTLGIEFQFYILLGLFYPTTNLAGKHWIGIILCILFILIIIYPIGYSRNFIFDNLPFFIMGYICYYTHSRQIKFYYGIVLLMSLCLFLIKYVAIRYGLISLFTLSIILLPTIKSKLLIFLGNISYSLYLIHSLVLTWLNKSFPLLFKADEVSLLGILLVCILASYLLYRFVEQPAIRLSKSIYLR